MKIPKYWARGSQTAQGLHGRVVTFTCWQWSEVSVDEARQQANDRAKTLAGKLLDRQKLDRYSYGERPLREEIVDAIKDGRGKDIALVTRNAYGALVLNAANAMFIDIDFAKEGPTPTGSAISRLFGSKKAPSQEERAIEGIEQWTRSRPDLGLRVYRTFGGLRCLVTNEVFDPTRDDALAILRNLNSDPLYIRLCQSQECFRARLTPKPWRCDLGKPPARYPWEDIQHEMVYRQWEKEYTRVAAQYAVCNLVKQIGPADVHPEVEPILSMHDRLSCSDRSLRLA